MGKRKRKTSKLKTNVKKLTGGGKLMSGKNIKLWCRKMTAK